MMSIKEIKETVDKEDYIFKIVVVGDSAVGKSNILSRYVQNDFNAGSKSTVGVELSSKLFQIEDKIVKVHIWDTAGQERYSSITSAYYRGAKGALVVYDITRRETFDNAGKWVNDIKSIGDKGTSIMMIGNKSDLTLLRKVSFDEAKEKADELSKIVNVN